MVRHTGDKPADVVRWVDRNAIDMDDEPEAFVMLRQGKRVMVLRHQGGRCRFLGSDDRCTIYTSRPLGCRLFPFDPTFDKRGNLRRLKIVKATEECPYELDGHNDPAALLSLHDRYNESYAAYYQKVADWNRIQRKRRRQGKQAQTGRQFLDFIGRSSHGS